jgi:hypothetical protein
VKTEIHLTLSDGSVWAIDGHVVAHNRATYYAEKDPDTTYEDEYKFTMGDEFELTDWASNNMNWDDVKHTARQVKPAPLLDWEEEWATCMKDVVQVPD